MFIILMTEVHIKIPDFIINDLSNYYNHNIPSLIHLYNHGICITQNINETTNLSLYLSNLEMPIYNINKEVSFYNNENLCKLNEIRIICNDNDNYIYLNDEYNKINFINSCNFCKNIQEIEFIETKIPNHILDNIDLGWLEKKKDYLFACDSLILLSDQINGMVIKVKEKYLTIFINALV